MAYTLKMLRVGKCLKQAEVATALNVNRKTVCAWEKGKSLPSFEKIEAICTFYGVSYDDIKWKP